MFNTPPPKVTSTDVTTTTSTTTITTATELTTQGERSYTSQFETQINPKIDMDQQRSDLEEDGTKTPENVDETGQKGRTTPLSIDLHSGRSTPSNFFPLDRNEGLKFHERVKQESPEAKLFFQTEMKRMAHKTKEFKDEIEKLKKELQKSYPDRVLAEKYMRSIQQHYERIRIHREDAISGFSRETKDADDYMEPKNQMYKEIEERFLAEYTIWELEVHDQGEASSVQNPNEYKRDIKTRASTPADWKVQNNNPQLEYRGGQNTNMLPPPSLPPTLMPPTTEDYRLLGGVRNPIIRPPPPPPPKTPMISRRPLVPQPPGGNLNRGGYICNFCQEDQRSLIGLEHHTLQVHGRYDNNPPQGAFYRPQPQYYQPQPQPQLYQPPPNQMGVEQMMLVMRQFFTESDERNREEQRRQQDARLVEQREMAKLNFTKEIEFFVKEPFDPNSIKGEGKKIPTFSRFKKDIAMLEQRMDQLQFPEIKKYEILLKLVKNDALDCIYKDNPTEQSFQESLIKLDQQFLSKSIGIRDLFHQLRNLPKMHDSQSSQVTKTVTRALNIMEQLMATPVQANDVWYLIFSEIMVPKMNKIAQDKWEKKVDRNIDETKPWGHSLVYDDLRTTLQETKTLMHHRELTAGYNKDPTKDGQQQVQSQKQKKKEEDEEAKRNSLFGQQTSSGETQENSNHGMPVNKNSPNKCPVPGCNASNEPMNKKDTAEAHKFVLNCPKLHGMNRKDCWDFYKESKCKCKKCFSTEHNWNSCPLVKIFPKFCKEKKKDGTNCGGEHHELLHWEPKGERSNRNQNTETYGSDSEEQSQE